MEEKPWHLAKFLSDMSTKTSQIRELLKKDVVLEWQAPQEKAFNKIKETLSATPVLARYDVTKPVVITCDVSKSGLGAALLQDNKPVTMPLDLYQMLKQDLSKLKKSCWQWYFYSRSFISTCLGKKH